MNHFIEGYSSEASVDSNDSVWDSGEEVKKSIPEYWSRVKSRTHMKGSKEQVWDINNDIQLWKDGKKRKSTAGTNAEPFLFDPDGF